MNEEVLKILTEKACASIRYRVRKEILEESPDISEYLDEILDDKRVQYVFTWQKADGYLGQSFHGGWIPKVKGKFFSTGAEAALRFLSEMGVPHNYPVVDKGLKALLKDNWNIDPLKGLQYIDPETGTYAMDHARAVVFAYFGIEEHDFSKTGIQQSLKRTNGVSEIKSIKDITGISRNKLYYNKGITLPGVYDLKLLAFTKSWRNNKNTSSLVKAIDRFIELSPLPEIYLNLEGNLYAPAAILPSDLKQSPRGFQPKEWFWWLHTMELFARMGIIKQIPVLRQQVNELKEMLTEVDGFFPVKPHSQAFVKWSTYKGLALEEDWRNQKWKYDLTFRALLILKHADML